MKHPEPQLLSGLLDGDLTPFQLREVEDHLSGCPGCRILYRELKEVQERARELPDRFPDRDLWPEIAEAIGDGHSTEAQVIELHPWRHTGSERKESGGFRISYLQAAAALALALFSGAAGALLTGSMSQSGSVPITASNPWIEMVGLVTPGMDDTAREVARLEALLGQHRSELDPTTILILEKNLGVIDQAIRESARALQVDPGNRFLESHLAGAVEAKASYLREATAFVAPMG